MAKPIISHYLSLALLLDIVLTLKMDVEGAVQSHIDDILGGDIFQKLREDRLKQLKEEATMKQEWLKQGHGEYSEIDERDFFETCKKSKNVVAHFYTLEASRCKIFDHHLKILAPKHLETKFIKIRADLSQFIVGRLNLKVIPTILVVIENITKDKIVGFTDLGNCDDFSTEMLEWRLARSAVINYDGDLIEPPEKRRVGDKINERGRVHTIKDSNIRYSDSDDD